MDDNVVRFPGTNPETITEEDFGPKLEVETVIDGLKEREFDDIIVLGTWENSDNIYFASTSGNLPMINWQLEKAKFILMQASLEIED